MTLKLVYDPDGGKALRDGEIESTYDYILETLKEELDGVPPPTFHFANEPIFHRIRLGVAEEEIDPTLIIFVVNDKKVTMNKLGGLNEWPRKGCLDLSASVSEKIIRAAIKTRKAEIAEKEQWGENDE